MRTRGKTGGGGRKEEEEEEEEEEEDRRRTGGQEEEGGVGKACLVFGNRLSFFNRPLHLPLNP